MKRFSCGQCGHEVYFDSMSCVSCGSALGFDPEVAEMLAAPEGAPFAGRSGPLTVCANRTEAACNWLLPQGSGTFCAACVHNHIIPNLSDPEYGDVWRRHWTAMELAKRHLFYSIMRWNLPHPIKVTPDDDGLQFDFRADEVSPDGNLSPVTTGHATGLITINISEGDDAERATRRRDLGEPYRTLVGHFRHEVGHYYWDRLVRDADPATLERCRALFGDDREDYGAALQAHYARAQAGFDDSWRDSYVSTYATAHAWEDFAETWAHYLHTVDALETAGAFGLRTVGFVDGQTHAVDFDPYVSGSLKDIIDAWIPVTVALNAINRSMGQPDFFPFASSEKPKVQEKLEFIHDIVRRRARVAPPTVEPTVIPVPDADADAGYPPAPQPAGAATAMASAASENDATHIGAGPDAQQPRRRRFGLF